MQEMRSYNVVTSNYRSNLSGNLSVSQLIVSMKLWPPYKFFNIMLHHIKNQTELVSVLMSEYPKGDQGAQSGPSHKASTTNFEIKTKFARIGIFFRRYIFLCVWAFFFLKTGKISKREFSIRGELHPIVALFLM